MILWDHSYPVVIKQPLDQKLVLQFDNGEPITELIYEYNETPRAKQQQKLRAFFYYSYLFMFILDSFSAQAVIAL